MHNWEQTIAIVAGILTIGSVALNIIQYRTKKIHERSLIAHLSQTYNWLYQIGRFAESGRLQLGHGKLSDATGRETQVYGNLCKITGVADAGRQGVKAYAKKMFDVELTYVAPYDEKITPTSVTSHTI
ncbi:MAG: hypothetical protein KAW52_07635, partial [candidate division Zixibacteria bacterium]|nr:hypothetical protein [candidate division Zixibacteria bacterium]